VNLKIKLSIEEAQKLAVVPSVKPLSTTQFNAYKTNYLSTDYATQYDTPKRYGLAPTYYDDNYDKNKKHKNKNKNRAGFYEEPTYKYDCLYGRD
jgi:hypothetical protein